MSTNLSAFLLSKLKSLKDGPTLAIQYKPSPSSHPEVLFTFFPKAISTTLTIVGGDRTSHLVILNWMLSCCDGRGLQDFQRIPPQDRPFSRYFFLKESASITGCTYPEKKFGECMDALAARQVHSEGVRALYLRLTAYHEMPEFPANHVAMLTWNGDLKTKGAYKTLREEIPAFNDAINNILEPLDAARREQKKVEREELYMNQRGVRSEQHRKQAENRRNGDKQVKKLVQKKQPEVEKAKIEEPAQVEAKKIIPGAEGFSQAPFFKNKAAKRRQKKREEKATKAAE